MEPSASSAASGRIKMVVYTQSLVQPPVMATLIQQLESQRGRIDFEVLQETSRIRTSVEQSDLSLLILTLHAKEELVDVLNVLSQVENRLQSGLSRAIVLNGLNHPRVIGLLKGKGVSEIVEFNVTIKALNHKIKNATLLVSQSHQRLNHQKIRASTLLGNEGGGKGSRTDNKNAGEVTWDKATEHPSDYWWLPSTRNARNVMGRWLIDLLGPGPSAGYWEETTYEREGEKGWEWKIRISTDPTFQPRSGRWLFFGRQPEFIWQKNLWSFVSKHPYLAFYAEGESEPELVRFETRGQSKLRAHENSEVSRLFLPKIQATLESSLKLSKNEGAGDQNGNIASPSENASSGSGSYSQSGGSAAPSADWNQHAESVGFGFQAKDHRISTEAPTPKWRNALTPDEVLAEKIGLAEIRQVGVVSGAKTFEKLVLNLSIAKKNDEVLLGGTHLRVMEVTSDRGVFQVPADALKIRDHLLLTVEFQLGNVEKKFGLEWICESLEAIEESGALAIGVFSGGALGEWNETLKLAEQRYLELQDFFDVAKGA